MYDELKEKLKDFGLPVFTILLDGLLVIVVGAIAAGVKYVLENLIFQCKLEEVPNKAVLTVYEISKLFLICVFLLYVAWDFISQIIRIFNRIKSKKR